jgi:NADH dehydrogenase [ubiquinone] 1 alpha subcomplex assembly factor 5
MGAAHTVGRRDEGEALPSGSAERARRLDDLVAAKAEWRQDGIQDQAAGACAKTPQASGQHRCIGPAKCADRKAGPYGGGLPAARLSPYIQRVTGLDPLLVFDRAVLRQRRDRAARGWQDRAFLKREIAGRLVERLDDVRRTFPDALDLGSHGDEIATALGQRSTVGWLVRADLGHGFARLARGPAIVADEEFLPFAAGSFDLVVSAMDLHWVNDLPGTLVQIRRILRPDGLLLGAMLGGATLWQLRQALAAAESEVEGGLSPRVSPFADLRDAAGLLQRAGFALPVADSETIDVEYDSALALMRDLGAMGESNLVVERRRGLGSRSTLLRAAEIYGERFALPSGRVAASFEVLFLHGWAPHESQPKPLRPGSAAQRLADALGTNERSAGEKVERG